MQRWGVGTGRKQHKKETVRVCKEMPGCAAHVSPANRPAADLPTPPGEGAALRRRETVCLLIPRIVEIGAGRDLCGHRELPPSPHTWQLSHLRTEPLPGMAAVLWPHLTACEGTYSQPDPVLCPLCGRLPSLMVTPPCALASWPFLIHNSPFY